MASRKEQREEARRQREAREAEERSRRQRKRRLWQIAGAASATAAIVIVAIAIASSGGDEQSPDGGGQPRAKSLFAGIPQNGLTLGDPDAKVTLYEFADLQCPFCKQYTDTVFPQLVEKYVKTGKVKMVWRNLTFLGPDSITGARATAAAGAQDKLWDYQHAFYKNQGAENSGYVTEKFLEDLARQTGVDVDKLKTDMNAPFVEQQLGQAQTHATDFGVNSTPTFLIQIGNGKPQKMNYQGFELEQFSRPIDEALKQAVGT